MKQLIAELDGLAEDMGRDGATGVNTVASASQQLARLERENAALRAAFKSAVILCQHQGDPGQMRQYVGQGCLLDGEVVLLMNRTAFDAARKEAQP